jgi:chromosome partitioning protein
MSDWDGYIASAESTMDAFEPNRNVSGAPHQAVRRAANATRAHVVLLDMNPNSNDLNRVLLMSSNYFIVPCKPEYFSFQAAGRLCQRLRAENQAGFGVDKNNWVSYTTDRVVPATANSRNPFPGTLPKYLGHVISDFAIRSRNGDVMVQGVDTHVVARNVGRWMTNILTRLSEPPPQGQDYGRRLFNRGLGVDPAHYQ